jgi:hypothetical protein
MNYAVVALVSVSSLSFALLPGCRTDALVDGDTYDSTGGASGTGGGTTSGGAGAGAAGTFTAVSGGLETACALRSNGTVTCWGDNTFKQVTRVLSGTFKSISMGDAFCCGVRFDGSVACNSYSPNDGTYANGARPTPQDGTYVAVSAGYSHACAISAADGSVVCWGANMGSDPAGSFVAVSVGDGVMCGIKTDGTLACWGSNNHGEAMPPSGTFVSVSTSDGFACAVRTDGTLACWGDNSSSQATPPPGADFVSVGAGQHFACAVRTNGTIACWGMNTSGEATPPAW